MLRVHVRIGRPAGDNDGGDCDDFIFIYSWWTPPRCTQPMRFGNAAAIAIFLLTSVDPMHTHTRTYHYPAGT